MCTIRIGVSVNVDSAIARYVASVSASCGRAIAWYAGAWCWLERSRVVILCVGGFVWLVILISAKEEEEQREEETEGESTLQPTS
jgi:hypothetical protein